MVFFASLYMHGSHNVTASDDTRDISDVTASTNGVQSTFASSAHQALVYAIGSMCPANDCPTGPTIRPRRCKVKLPDVLSEHSPRPGVGHIKHAPAQMCPTVDLCPLSHVLACQPKLYLTLCKATYTHSFIHSNDYWRSSLFSVSMNIPIFTFTSASVSNENISIALARTASSLAQLVLRLRGPVHASRASLNLANIASSSRAGAGESSGFMRFRAGVPIGSLLDLRLRPTLADLPLPFCSAVSLLGDAGGLLSTGMASGDMPSWAGEGRRDVWWAGEGGRDRDVGDVGDDGAVVG
jgi:hypothetical protein